MQAGSWLLQKLESLGDLKARDDNFAKCSGGEQRKALTPLQIAPEPPDRTIEMPELAERRLFAPLDERIGKGRKNSGRCSIVNVRIEAVDVAEAHLQPVLLRFDEIPAMTSLGKGERNGQSELKGHVEAGDTRGATGELDARQVVHRRRALPDQTEEALEPAPVRGNLEDTTRRKAEPSEASDQGKEETLVVVVEGTVEEDVRPFGTAATNRHEAVYLRFTASWRGPCRLVRALLFLAARRRAEGRAVGCTTAGPPFARLSTTSTISLIRTSSAAETPRSFAVCSTEGRPLGTRKGCG